MAKTENRIPVKNADLQKLIIADQSLDLANTKVKLKEAEIENAKLKIKLDELENSKEIGALVKLRLAADKAKKKSLADYKSVAKKYKVESERWGVDLEKGEIIEG